MRFCISKLVRTCNGLALNSGDSVYIANSFFVASRGTGGPIFERALWKGKEGSDFCGEM
jgi:hypothetical protein